MKIGVFDSGFGGLTVLRELLRHIPAADYAYLGDTARLPYGAKSRATVARYAASSARFLVEEEEAELLVIACNTASALALEAIREAVAVPVLGVVETGANAADVNSTTRDVLVIATAATVESHAYAAACAARKMRVIEKACPLLVPLVEEGWTEHPVTNEVVRIYMDELMEQAAAANLKADTLVLACTHYPLLRETIERAVPQAVRVIDSAEVTAQQVAVQLGSVVQSAGQPKVQFFATDSVAKFKDLGTRFLGQAIPAVRLVDLGG
ncbi:MAG TPA: glutamate racemase [Acidobacteriaceae bacterium]|jgi:glutamate racemase|nr:glutamate racemase [Acidobacteriaceae bacterium]